MVTRKKYILTIVLTTVIFISGVYVGTLIVSTKLEQLRYQLQKDFLESQSLELELMLVEGKSCEYVAQRLPEIIKTKVELGRRLDAAEKIENAELVLKQYIISLVKYWLFSDLQEKNCGIKKPVVMFFFDYSEVSREQGKVLDYLVYKSNQSLVVFAFNTQLKEPLLTLLMERHNITQAPSLMIANTVYAGFQPKEKLIEILCKNYELIFCQA